MARPIDPYDQEVGKCLRIYRVLANLSQEKVGEHLGVTFQQVQKYEKGTNRISSGRLMRLAQLLNQPVTAFYPNAHPKKVGEPNAVFALADDKDAIQLLHVFNSLPAKRRALVCQFADVLRQGS